MAILEEISTYLQNGRSPKVKELVQQAIDEGIDPAKILNEGLLSGMDVIGEKFKNNEVFVPEVLIAARAMNAGVGILKPYLVSAGVESKGTAVIGTVKGDLHDIGKNLVAIMLKGAGYEVIDLGVNCDVAKYEEGVAKGATIVACSSLLTTTMPYMREVVEHFRGRGVKVIIGGAPVTADFAAEIGADGFSEDANGAVRLVDSLVRTA